MNFQLFHCSIPAIFYCSTFIVPLVLVVLIVIVLVVVTAASSHRFVSLDSCCSCCCQWAQHALLPQANGPLIHRNDCIWLFTYLIVVALFLFCQKYPLAIITPFVFALFLFWRKGGVNYYIYFILGITQQISTWHYSSWLVHYQCDLSMQPGVNCYQLCWLQFQWSHCS